MALPNRFDDQVGKWSSKMALDFVKELDLLNITVDEYEHLLAELVPSIVTTDKTSP